MAYRRRRFGRSRRRLIAGPALRLAGRAASKLVKRYGPRVAGQMIRKYPRAAAALGVGAAAGIGAVEYAGYQRKRTAGVARVGTDGRPFKRRRYTRRSGSSSFIKRSRVRFGRNRVATLGSMVTMMVPKRVCRFQALRSQDQVGTAAGMFPTGADTVSSQTTVDATFPGRFVLAYCRNDTASWPDTFPMHILDLTCTNNSSTTHNPFWGMGVKTNGSPVFSTFVGDDASGSGSTYSYWGTEFANFSDASPEARFISPRWYDIRMVLYGAIQSQTVFTIQYVQMNGDEFDPWHNATTFTGEQERSKAAWYSAQVRSYVTSSIVPVDRKPNRPGWKVLKQWTYSIAPNLTIDHDATPNSQIVRLFLRDGRLLRYVEKDNNTVATDVRVADPTGWRQVQSNNDLTRNQPVVPRQRRFLIIKANVSTSTTASTANPNICPCYDICIRKKEYVGLQPTEAA